MLARQFRLASSRDISRVMQRGRWHSSGPLTMKALATPAPFSRVVVVVSKKVSKKATIRNRIRRRVVAALHSRWATVAPGYDIVIVVRTDISDSPAEELESHIAALIGNVRSTKPTT